MSFWLRFKGLGRALSGPGKGAVFASTEDHEEHVLTCLRGLVDGEMGISEARQQISTFGVESHPGFKKALRDADPNIRSRAAWGLYYVAGDKHLSLSLLVKALQREEDPGVCHSIVNSIQSIAAAIQAEEPEFNITDRGRDAVTSLLQTYDAHQDLELRKEVLETLGVIRGKQGLLQLVESLGSPVSIIRSTAAYAIEMGDIDGEIVTAEDIPTLLRCVLDPDSLVRSASTRLLGVTGTGNDEVESALVELLKDDEVSVREAAVRSLGLIGSYDVLEPIRQLLQSGRMSGYLAFGETTRALSNILCRHVESYLLDLSDSHSVTSFIQRAVEQAVSEQGVAPTDVLVNGDGIDWMSIQSDGGAIDESEFSIGAYLAERIEPGNWISRDLLREWNIPISALKSLEALNVIYLDPRCGDYRMQPAIALHAYPAYGEAAVSHCERAVLTTWDGNLDFDQCALVLRMVIDFCHDARIAGKILRRYLDVFGRFAREVNWGNNDFSVRFLKLYSSLCRQYSKHLAVLDSLGEARAMICLAGELDPEPDDMFLKQIDEEFADIAKRHDGWVIWPPFSHHLRPASFEKSLRAMHRGIEEGDLP